MIASMKDSVDQLQMGLMEPAIAPEEKLGYGLEGEGQRRRKLRWVLVEFGFEGL